LKDWSGYLTLGITTEHIPDLIQLLEDESLFQTESEDSDAWAVIHAWRTLAELKAEAAIPALIAVLRHWGNEDPWWEWLGMEFPRVFGAIGTVAIPALTEFVADSSGSDFSRSIAAQCLTAIAEQYPDRRLQCIEGINQTLEGLDQNSPELNADLIDALIEMKAVESAALIEQAFQLNCVDENIAGDWDEVQVNLGLKSREELPRKRFNITLGEPPERESYSSLPEFGGFGGASKKSKTKAKRKQQQESRKKNRGKKK
jgi:hypothetical protein